MTHFAAVAPLAIHRELDKVGMLGTYQLLIATEVLKDPDEYADFWQHRTPDQYIILDNGVIEEGFPLLMKDLVRSARLVDANAIVLPDAIDDCKMTIKLARKTAAEYFELGGGRDLVGVVQGTTWDECLNCADTLVDIGVDRLAVPRGLTKNLGSRVELVQYIADTYGKLMHVLGFSDNVADDIEAAASHKLVVGMDAATPVWAALNWIELPVDPPTDSKTWGSRPSDFWQSAWGLHQPDDGPASANLIIDNLERVRGWLSDAVSRRQSK